MSLKIKQIENLQTELDSKASGLTGRLSMSGPIKQFTVDTATDTITISGLDLSTDSEYLVTARIVNDNGATSDYYVYAGDPTLDTTNTNYDTQLITDGVTSEVDEPRWGTLGTSEESYVRMYISQATDGTFRASAVESKSGTQVRGIDYAILSTTTFGTITQIQLKSELSSGFGVGTSVHVYRLGGSFNTGTSLTPLDVKRVADSFDDEFTEETLDSSWTAVSGSSGTVDFTGNGAPGGGNGVYDLSTRSGWLLLQGDNTEDVQLRKDYTLPQDRSVVMKIASAGQITGVNNRVRAGLSLNDDDGDFSNGNSLQLFVVEVDTDQTMEIQLVSTGTFSASGTITQRTPVGSSVYLRMLRTSGGYEIFVSWDGTSWVYMDTETTATVLDNVWIFNQPSGASSGNVPIQAVDWIRLGNSTVDPWPLVDGSTVQPVSVGEFRGSLIYKDSAQSIPSTTDTAIVWNQLEYDTDGFSDIGGSNPERLTVPAGVSRVRLHGQITTANISTQSFLYIHKNGSKFAGAPVRESDTGGIHFIGGSSAVVDVIEGDYFELIVHTQDAGDLNVAEVDRNWFAIEVVEPVVAIDKASSLEISNSDSPFSIQAINRRVYVDTTAGNVEVDLPTISGNHDLTYTFIQVAGTNNILLDPNGTENINGSSTTLTTGGTVGDSITIAAKNLGSNTGWWQE